MPHRPKDIAQATGAHDQKTRPLKRRQDPEHKEGTYIGRQRRGNAEEEEKQRAGHTDLLLRAHHHQQFDFFLF